MNIDTINKLLYVPFNHDYAVDEKTAEKLTEEEFFENCFVDALFEEKIKNILNSEDEIKDFEVDITKEELIKKLEKQENEKKNFENWLSSNQNDIFCVTGDAGTGKSTFLHQLQYISKKMNKKLSFDIIDVQNAVEIIQVLNYKITVPKFSSIYYKSISSILLIILNSIFIYTNEDIIMIDESISNIYHLLENYNIKFSYSFPDKFVSGFFDGITDCVTSNVKNFEICQNIAEFISSYFSKAFSRRKNSKKSILNDCILLLLYIVICENPSNRHIISFDNFERFVGVDEIFSNELTEFVDSLRCVQNNIAMKRKFLSNHFQIVIFMRRTSTRMFTSQQITELLQHSIDLSEWFDVSEIIANKICWYEENNIALENCEILKDVLFDTCFHNGNQRGISIKLYMLFNNNKRVLVTFLNNLINYNLYIDYIDMYKKYMNNDFKIKGSCARFAKRSIIFRLALNQLENDKFFSCIQVQQYNNQDIANALNNEKYEAKEYVTENVGYARKILTILYDFKLENDDSYMPLEDLIVLLFPNKIIDDFFDSNNKEKRKQISSVLYAMNYYDNRKGNWLQFIDIQYNIEDAYDRISTQRKFENLIDRNHANINIRITEAGIAYLYFVVYSFEYFSCKSKNSPLKKKIFGTGDMPPLLSIIPSVDEIKSNDLNNSICITIIDSVASEAISCIKKMESDNNVIPFRKNKKDNFILHKNRIINSHIGFIDNYIWCLREIYKDKTEQDSNFELNLNNLVEKIESIRNRYYSWIN